MAASHPVPAHLAPHVRQVRTGTPLRPGPEGWVIAPLGEHAQAYAASAARGGERLMAWRVITLETYRPQFIPGERYDIADIDATGYIRFAAGGRYTAHSETRLLLDAGISGVPARSEPAEQSPPPAPPPRGTWDNVTGNEEW